MIQIPRFKMFGEGDPKVREVIQPSLGLRTWDELTGDDKIVIYQQLVNLEWTTPSEYALKTVHFLNNAYLVKCPGKVLHRKGPIQFRHNMYQDSDHRRAAQEDFKFILIHESHELVFTMFSVFANNLIKEHTLTRAEEEQDDVKRQTLVNDAFSSFDRFANCLNHIFEQFGVNGLVTRSGIVPRQDKKIADEVYLPTLAVLSDPKWKAVTAELSGMFTNYQKKSYPEVITDAHNVLHKFLQILIGEDGRNAKGEVGKLFSRAKDKGLIPLSRFSDQIIPVIQGFVVSERASKSSSKPVKEKASPSDALLVMNVVMVLLQFLLQEGK